jgi:hypothetical protein
VRSRSDWSDLSVEEIGRLIADRIGVGWKLKGVVDVLVAALRAKAKPKPEAKIETPVEPETVKPERDEQIEEPLEQHEPVRIELSELDLPDVRDANRPMAP